MQFVSEMMEHSLQEQTEAGGHKGSQAGEARHFKCFSFQISAAHVLPGAALCCQLAL